MKDSLNIFYPTDKSVIDFIKLFDEIYQKKLTNHFNFPRVVALSDFHRLVTEMNLKKFENVAVISGPQNEPETRLINYEKIDILQFNEVSNLFNLDEDWKKISISDNIKSKHYKIIESKYDFILCNQVFEHIFSPQQGLKNISFVAKKNSYVWISLPTINCIHGEPYFYSAGYHPRFLDRIFRESGFEVIHIGAWGNRKYLAYAVQGKWLTNNELKRSIKSKLDFAHPYFAMTDGRKNDTSGKFITDTWGLFKKKE